MSDVGDFLENAAPFLPFVSWAIDFFGGDNDQQIMSETGLSEEGLKWWREQIMPMLQQLYKDWGTPEAIEATRATFTPTETPEYQYTSPYGSLTSQLTGQYRELPPGVAEWANKHIPGGEAALRQSMGWALAPAPGEQIPWQDIGYTPTTRGWEEMQRAAGLLGEVAGGKYLGMENPELQRVEEAIRRNYMRDYQNTLASARSGLSAGFMGASSAAPAKLGLLASNAAEGLGDILARQRMGLYEAERGRQQTAQQLLGSLGGQMTGYGIQEALNALGGQTARAGAAAQQAALQQGNLGMAADIMQRDIANQRFTTPLEYQYLASLNPIMANLAQFNASQQMSADMANQQAAWNLINMMMQPLGYLQGSQSYGYQPNEWSSVLGSLYDIWGAYDRWHNQNNTDNQNNTEQEQQQQGGETQ